jgi:hypothetical protein
VSVQLEDGDGVTGGKVAFGGPDGQPQQGLGDEAFWNARFDVLWVHRGGRGLTIQVVNPALPNDILRDHAIQLAQQVLPKV